MAFSELFSKCLEMNNGKLLLKKGKHSTFKTAGFGDLFCDFRFGPHARFYIILKIAFDQIFMLTLEMCCELIYLSIKPILIKIGT